MANKQQMASDLQRNIMDAIKLSRSNQMGPQNIPIDPSRPKLQGKTPGFFATEETKTFEIDGKFYNIPTIINGRRVSDQEAIEYFKGSGKHVGVFDTLEEAVESAKARSSQIGMLRGGKAPRTFIFNEPGDFNQQTTPVVEVPGQDKSIGIEGGNSQGLNMQQIINEAVQKINQKKQFKLQTNLMNMFKNKSMMRGQAGPVSFQGGVGVRPGRSGKPDFRAMLGGKIPF